MTLQRSITATADTAEGRVLQRRDVLGPLGLLGAQALDRGPLVTKSDRPRGLRRGG